MASQIPQVLRASAKPILSSTYPEARRRALNLYRAWYREVIRSLKLLYKQAILCVSDRFHRLLNCIYLTSLLSSAGRDYDRSFTRILISEILES